MSFLLIVEPMDQQYVSIWKAFDSNSKPSVSHQSANNGSGSQQSTRRQDFSQPPKKLAFDSGQPFYSQPSALNSAQLTHVSS